MMLSRKYHGFRRIVRLCIAVCLCVTGISFYLSKYGLQVTHYTLESSRIRNSIRIVQLTDLHDSVFGEDNCRLVEKVEEQSPDLIVITGDLLNADVENTDIAVSLIRRLEEIAPVYVSLGNHEYEYEKNYDTDIVSLYEKAGADVLDFEYEDITVNGQTVRIAGGYGYFLPEKFLKTGESKVQECMFLNNVQDTDLYTILLTHMPAAWTQWESLDEWDIDCVFSGHVHGGEVILPFIGGVYAPDYGWFPGKLQGLYYSEDQSSVLVLSRGLGTTEKIPRFNNIPEVMVVDLVPEQ